MRKVLLIISFTFTFLFSKSQLLQPQVINSLEEYFFVPVAFDNLGNWIKIIENDTSINFKEKTYFLQDDSIYLHFEMEKPGFPLHYKNGSCKLIIHAQTQTNNWITTETEKSSIKFIHSPPAKVTNMNLSLIIAFDSTERGQQMAQELQNSLDDSIKQYFGKKLVYNGNKKLKALKHPNIKTRKCIHYYLKDEPISIFTISNTVKNNKNQIALYLNYSLNN